VHSRLEIQLQWGQLARLQLLEEISLLQRRLHLMGGDGDCAYERAISRLYEDMVADRWRQLAQLACRTC